MPLHRRSNPRPGTRAKRATRRTAPVLCERLDARRLLSTTYYFSPAGSDLNSGTSAASPWQSLNRINTLDLEPGDKVLLEGGQTFAEPDLAIPLVNPGFESGTTGWDQDFGNATVLAGIGHNSLRALRIGTGEGGMAQTITSLVEPEKTYTFGVFGRTSNAFELGYVGISFKDSAGNRVGGVELVVGGIFYKQYAKTFVAPASFASADIWAYKFLGANPFFLDVDNYSLVENKNSIFLDAADSGTSQSPVTIGSYGTGRATVNSHTGLGLYVYNAGGYEVSNLNFTGSGPSTNRASGITFFSDLGGNQKLDHIRIDDINVSGYGDAGISIGGWYDPFSTNGYRDVVVSNSNAFNNGRAGIHTWGPGLYSHENVTIRDNRVYNTTGANEEHSGDGILLGSTSGGLVRRNIVHSNGGMGTGTVGVRTYNSTNVVVESNESYNNRTGSTTDGGGFALDWGTTNSVLQYNYSHGNDGSGFLLAARTNTHPTGNNTIRYNISENDGRKNGYAGLHVWNEEQSIADSHIYNNTVYISASGTITQPKALWLQSPDPFFATSTSDVKVRNNILFAANGARLVEATAGQTGPILQGNDYWTAGAPFDILWQGTSYSSLPALRSGTGQERDGAIDVGLNVNPMLTAPGAGGTIGNPDLLATNLTAYRTLTGSPVRDAGLNLPLRFGINPGARDFYAADIPQGTEFDIGAHEAVTDDVIAPTINASQFNYLTQQDVTIQFSEDVSASVQLEDLVVQNLTTNQTIPSSAFTLSLSGGGGAPTTATWIAQSILPDGNYRATLPAGSVQDPAGNALAADHVLNFHVLAGDANRDARVNLSDFNVLAANFGQSNRDFSQGDFNYDTIVNLSDFNLLASRFGTTLSPTTTSSDNRGLVGDDDDERMEDQGGDDLLA